MNHTANGPLAAERRVIGMFWYAGTDALTEGEGLCFNQDYGTATDADASRGNRVERPSNTNNRHFAGVAARDYVAATAGQFIEVVLPGSICKVYTTVDTVIGVGALTALAGGDDAGKFGAAGFGGRGTAVPLETVTASGGAKVLAQLQDGAESGLVEVLTLTAGGASEMSLGGVSRFAAATPASDATYTLADGTVIGERKLFIADGTQTTHDVLVTFTTAKQLNGTTALATAEFDAAGDVALVEWNGAHWKLISWAGATLAS